MAARTRRTSLDESWRNNIRASQLINRLTGFIEGKVELNASQVKAIEILLRKVAPDLARVDNQVDGNVILNVVTGVPDPESEEEDVSDLC